MSINTSTNIQKLSDRVFNKLVKQATENGSASLISGSGVSRTEFDIILSDDSPIAYYINGIDMHLHSFKTEIRLSLEINRTKINPIKSELARAPHNGYIGAESNVDGRMSMVNKDGASKEFKESPTEALPNICRGNSKRDKTVSFHDYQDSELTLTSAQRKAKAKKVMFDVHQRIRDCGKNVNRTCTQSPKDSSKAERNKRRKAERIATTATVMSTTSARKNIWDKF